MIFCCSHLVLIVACVKYTCTCLQSYGTLLTVCRVRYVIRSDIFQTEYNTVTYLSGEKITQCRVYLEFNELMTFLILIIFNYFCTLAVVTRIMTYRRIIKLFYFYQTSFDREQKTQNQRIVSF
jgi:hypothetical protein